MLFLTADEVLNYPWKGSVMVIKMMTCTVWYPITSIYKCLLWEIEDMLPCVPVKIDALRGRYEVWSMKNLFADSNFERMVALAKVKVLFRLILVTQPSTVDVTMWSF